VDTGSPVSNTYKPPFAFTGQIEKVDIDLGQSGLAAADEKKVDDLNKKAWASTE
jgi:arylsulfatase